MSIQKFSRIFVTFFVVIFVSACVSESSQRESKTENYLEFGCLVYGLDSIGAISFENPGGNLCNVTVHGSEDLQDRFYPSRIIVTLKEALPSTFRTAGPDAWTTRSTVRVPCTIGDELSNGEIDFVTGDNDDCSYKIFRRVNGLDYFEINFRSL